MISEEGAKTLDGCVWELTRKGFVVTQSTESSVQMTRPKKFSAFWALAWFLLFGVGLAIYIIYYVSKNDDTAYITQAPDGTVRGRLEYSDALWGRRTELVGEGAAEDREERAEREHRNATIGLSILGGLIALVVLVNLFGVWGVVVFGIVGAIGAIGLFWRKDVKEA